MAVTTFCLVLPRAVSLLKRAHKRSWAFQAIWQTRSGNPLLAFEQQTTDPSLHPVCPGGFNQGFADMAVAGFGDSASFDALATGVLGRHQAQIGHQLGGFVKTAQVSQFCKHGHRYDQRNAPGSLQGCDHRG